MDKGTINKRIIKQRIIKQGTMWLFCLLTLLFFLPAVSTKADTVSVVSIGAIDYESLTMQIYNNNNNIVSYSTDKSNWTDVEGAYSNANSSYTMDISWISVTSDVTLYFKGDVVKTVKSITLPAQNKDFSIIYNKAEGEFTFNEIGDANCFEWRKSSDYSWTTVSLDETSTSYLEFNTKMGQLRVKGASIIFRLPQEKGTGSGNPGTRQSSEKTISITIRGTAPTVKVNSSKMTINTTTAMEYCDLLTGLWVECEGAMSLEEIAPKTLYENGGNSVTLMIRKTATSSAPYSKTQYLTIVGQAAAPVLGDSSSDVTYYYLNSKLVMQFNNASSTNIYEYAIVKSSSTFSLTSASWKSVATTKILTLSTNSAPDGCKIYIRKKGTDGNISAKTSVILSSAVNSFTVKF